MFWRGRPLRARALLPWLISSCFFLPAGWPITWREAQRADAAWLKSDEGRRVVANVLAYQLPNGGWPKNVDMATPLTDEQRAALAARQEPGTIDNGATYSQVRFLARAVTGGEGEAARAAAERGLQFLLQAQYENGGWPMFFPLRKGYYEHIDFNDDAMVGVLRLLRDVAGGAEPFAWVPAELRVRCGEAVARGIVCIVRTQVVVDGRRTAWCAQHDARTLAPAAARRFEPVSLSGLESAGIVEFLMGVPEPSSEVVEAIEGAVAWFQAVTLKGVRVVEEQTAEGEDRRLVEDPAARPLWARFYEIGTNRPIFTGRDGVVRYRFDEIERERRAGYAYFTTRPARLLERDYPAWQKRRAAAVP